MENFFSVLKKVLKDLNRVNFCVLGSFNLYLHGADIIPHDLDFITDDESLKKVASLYNSKITNEFGYLETEFEIDNVGVHFVSNNNNEPFMTNDNNQFEWINRENLDIPCRSLQSELEAYKKMTGEKYKNKVKIIEDLILKSK